MELIEVLSDNIQGGDADKKLRLQAVKLAQRHAEWESKHKGRLRYHKTGNKTWVLRHNGDTSPVQISEEPAPQRYNGKRRAVQKIINGVVIHTYPSIGAAAKGEGIPATSLSNILHGRSNNINEVTYLFSE